MLQDSGLFSLFIFNFSLLSEHMMIEKRERGPFDPIEKNVQGEGRELECFAPSFHRVLLKSSHLFIELITNHDAADADSRNAQNPQIFHCVPEIARPEVLWRRIELVAADVPQVKRRELRQTELDRIPKTLVASSCGKLRPCIRTVIPEDRLRGIVFPCRLRRVKYAEEDRKQKW